MTKVYWVPVGKKTLNTVYANAWMNLMHKTPEPILKTIIAERTKQAYFKCPAFIEMCRNTYLLRSPVDMHLEIDRKNKYLYIKNQNQDFFDEFLRPRFEDSSEEDPYILSAPPSYLFYSDTSVRMELHPTFLINNPLQDRLKLIPAAYDIGKWVRPIEFAAEVVDDTKPIIIKEGDPLIAVRFVTPDNSLIRLERVELTKQIEDAINSCVGLKEVKQNMKLDQLYEYAKEYLSVIFKRDKEKS